MSVHARNEQHNAVQKFLTQKLSASAFTAFQEPAIKAVNGALRPDTVVYKTGEEAAVIDVTVVADTLGSSTQFRL